MDAERWEQIKATFHTALEREPSELAAFLNQACSGDAALRAEVESLLAAHEDAADFIEVTSLEPPADLPAEGKIDSTAGRRIGQYMIDREIAHGGMGTVYLAARADDQYQEQVAIKLIRSGAESGFITRRFRSERQILANLNHPNIARLLDGGATEDGLPYFVMEYIDGRPVTEYCDANNLSVSDRLKLFRAVCSAVHYAHQNLIVHRDVKPGNILVTADGTPKLLDFGIAKLLGPELSYTADAATLTAMRVMTPDYASPEQIRGEPITTASDIYSLGVLLYELLTGHRPYHFKSRLPHEIAQAVCEEEPEKPSTAVTRVEEVCSGDSVIKLTPGMVSGTRDAEPAKLRRQLAGDLDNIVLMAMRKEPSRRYASAEQLSEDIRRHLNGLPVIARKDTFVYRGGKFVKRHTASVAAAALVVLVLLAGLVATLWEARVARAQRARAEVEQGKAIQRFDDVRKLANSFMFEFHDAIKDLPGATPARELVVKKALEYLDSLARQSGGDQSLQAELAEAYVKVGDVQGRPGFANLGDTAGALLSYEKALSIREALCAAEPSNLPSQFDLASTIGRIGEIQAAKRDFPGALESYRRQFGICEELSKRNPTDAQARKNISINYYLVGTALAQAGDLAGALESHSKALAMFTAVLEMNPADSNARRNVSLGNKRVGAILARTERNPEALEHYQRALEIDKALSEANPTNAEARMDLSFSYSEIGYVLTKNGDLGGALESYRKALTIREALSAADPRDARASSSLASTYAKIGRILAKSGDTRGALRSHLRALAIRERLSAANPADPARRSALADSYSDLGETRALQAAAPTMRAAASAVHWREARSWYQQSLSILIALREQGKLGGLDEGEPARISREILRCDAALKGLRPTSDPR